MTIIRDLTEKDFLRVLDLNDSEVQHTSAMDIERLEWLCSLSAYRKVAVVDDEVAGFILVMREGAVYPNENYDFFATRYPEFLYVDRIVVDQNFAGRRVGSAIYEHLFGHARSSGVAVVTCEYNLVPPNLPSQAFHNKFGFKEQGTQWLNGRSKKVSLQASLV